MSSYSHDITIQEFWDSAHSLSLPYASKCNKLHGHRYTIDVLISGSLDENGMVADFAKVKEHLKQFDHVHLNDFFSPSTAENIASTLLFNLNEIVKSINSRARVQFVEVRESPTTMARARWDD